MARQMIAERESGKILVWTFDSDPDAGQAAPIGTTCTDGPIDGRRTDDEGRYMFVNTHFVNVADAWKALSDNAEAHERSCAREYRNAQDALKAATRKLADVAAFASEVREARRKAGA